MKTPQLLPNIVLRDFSVNGSSQYPKFYNLDKLKGINSVPASPTDEFNFSTDSAEFAWAYVNNAPAVGVMNILDIRLVKNGQIYGNNLLTTPVNVSDTSPSWSQTVTIPISETPISVKEKSFGVAVSFRFTADGVDTDTEHISMMAFEPDIASNTTISGLNLEFVLCQSPTFAPPSYPRIMKLFNIKTSFNYSFDQSGMKLEGAANSYGFIKPVGYEHKTEDIGRRYQYMVYDNGKFLGELNDVSEVPSVRTALNSFPGDVKIEVPRNMDSDTEATNNFDIIDDNGVESLVSDRNESMLITDGIVKSFGEDSLIDTNNTVDIHEYYGNYEGFALDDNEPLVFHDMNELETPVGSPEGNVYFSGYISKYKVSYGKESRKTSKLTLLSHSDEYNNIVLERTDSDILTLSGSDQSYWTGLGKQPLHYPARDNSKLAQTFMFSSGKRISTIYLKCRRTSADDILPSQYPVVYVKIIEGNPDSGGAVVGTAFASISKTDPYWQSFSFPADLILRGAQRYSAIIYLFEPMLVGMYASQYPVEFYSTSGYGSGSAYIESSTANSKTAFSDSIWTEQANIDMQMRIAESGGETMVEMLSTDPSEMFKKIIDYGQSKGSQVRYLDNSIMMSNTVVSAKYNLQTLKDALDSAIKYSPTDWYWYVDQSDLTVYLNKRSEEVSHYFTLNKDIESIDFEKTMEDLINEVYFTGGNATADIARPLENKYYPSHADNPANRVSSQIFLPDPYVEYKITADYPDKSCEVILYKYYNGSTAPTSNSGFVESGKLTFRYDEALDPTLTGISICIRTTDQVNMSVASTKVKMVSESNVYRHLVNNTSQSSFRKALVKKTDHRVTNSDSADIIANSFMERSQKPIHVGTAHIIRDAHKEKVYPGQLVGFRNFGNYIDDLKLVVMEVEISRDIIILTLGAFAPKASKRLEDLKRNLQVLEQANNPDAPTTTGGV